MLTGRETFLLKTLLSFCSEEGGSLISEEELWAKLKFKKFTEKNFRQALFWND